MTVLELMERLTGIGATVSAEGDHVAVRFSGEHRREVEGLGPEIQRLKPELLHELATQSAQPHNSPEDIDLALKIGFYLETLSSHRSVTASEIAETFHGRDYTLEQVIEIFRICEELREARILIRGWDGYGYCLPGYRKA